MPRADHFAFQVSDMENSIEFYSAKLGLKLLFSKVDEERHEAFAFLELEGGDLELLQSLDENNLPVPFEKKFPVPPYCPHLALETKDMDELVATAGKNDILIIKGPLENPGLARWIYLSDPDGNVVEFIQWIKKE